ncbi:MAG: NUMOD3 domain-containing DNA-binding protein, partial [Patescibacteria group bacterium]
VPWNRDGTIPSHAGFQKGNKLWMSKKNFKHTEESKKKIRIARARQVITEEHKRAISRKLKGRKPKHSAAGWNKGKSAWWSIGKPRTEETKKKIGDAQRGALNHAWRGGISPLRVKIMNHPFYRKWQLDIMARDNFTCVLDGKIGKLAVDHFPISFSLILRRNNIKNLNDALDCKGLWDISNGRTLCKPCHLETPNYGGRARKEK